MREIEFRGISTENGQFVYGDLYHGLNGLIYINTVVELSEKSKCNQQILVHFETAGQYTGLKDKNGVKIFEGDILQTDTISQYVDFNEYLSCFGVRNINGGCTMSIDKSWEVIGNIHQNPELLQ